jgi:hypothetical protein
LVIREEEEKRKREEDKLQKEKITRREGERVNEPLYTLRSPFDTEQ